jgi:hypothetical protein
VNKRRRVSRWCWLARTLLQLGPSGRICVTAETPVHRLGTCSYLTAAGGAGGSLQVPSFTGAQREGAGPERERGTEQASLDADRLSGTVTSEVGNIDTTLPSAEAKFGISP